MHGETILLVLFVVATAVAIAARRFGFPYTVALVAAGLFLGAIHAFEAPHLTKELLFAVFLPPLLFEAAYHIEFREFWRDKTTVLSLAVPGVAASVALTTVLLGPVAGATHTLEQFGWQHALLFSALIAATDPIAVVGLFKSLGAPRRLAILVEGESLLNDGTSIVFFTLVLGLVGGMALSAATLAIEFVVVVGGGLLVGIAIGSVVSFVIQQVDDPMIEITLTTIAAYGAFLVGEQLLVSGVIGTVTAGMLCGNYGARTGMSPTTRIASQTFWEYLAFALNSVVFLLIGLEVSIGRLLASWQAILVAYLAVTLGRAVVIFGVTGVLRRTAQRMPSSWSAVLSWGGLRGALSMVLVLGLPRDLPQRDLLVTMTFGVVVLSILIQGLSMGPLLRALNVVSAHASRASYHLARARLQAAGAARAELDEMQRTRMAHGAVVDALREEYDERIRRAEAEIDDLHIEKEQLRQEELTRARRHLLLIEKDKVMDAFRQGTVDQRTYERLLADVDARLLELDQSADPRTDGGAEEG
jgi:CPA1 family monovalent cation:H+ antiporter